MNTYFQRLLPVLCIFCCTLGAEAQAGRPTLTSGSCPLENCAVLANDKSVQWGVIELPENRQRPGSGKVRLQVLKLNCLTENTASSPLFILNGGPGEGTIGFWRFWYDHPLRKKHDIILYDQRGTGYSQPRLCPFLADSILAIIAGDHTTEREAALRMASAQQCKDSLERRKIDINAYSSKDNAADLDDLRLAMGYSKINILGISYGSRLALTYMRDYPASLIAVILDSSIPPDGRYFEDMSVSLSQSLEKVCQACAADHACKAMHSDLKRQILETEQDLERSPLAVEWKDHASANNTFVLNGQDYVLILQQLLYQDELLPLFPAIVDEFHHRNKAFVSTLISFLGDRLNGFDYGVYYSVLSNETMPFNHVGQYIKKSADSSLFPGGVPFYGEEFAICGMWNDRLPDSSEGKAVHSQVPTLILQGKYDPITPPADGKLALQSLPNGRYIEFPLRSHAVSFSPKAQDIIQDFLADPLAPSQASKIDSRKQISFINDLYRTSGIFNMLSRLYTNDGNVYLVSIVIPLIVFVLFLLSFLVVVVIRLMKNGKKVFSRGEKVIIATGLLISLLGISYYAGMLYSINESDKINPFVLLFGLPGFARYYVYISWLIAVLSVLSLYNTFTIFRKNLLTTYWRILYSFLAAGCVMYTGLLMFWGMF